MTSSLKRLAKKILPASTISELRRRYRGPRDRLRGALEVRRDRALLEARPEIAAIPFPPPRLRYKVAGAWSLAWFHDSGQKSRADLEAALATVDRKIGSFDRVLDFGCGCGRILRALHDIEGPRYYGTDIEAELVGWAAEHLSSARFSVNRPLPPLDLEDQEFDLVYSHSVFSHLDEEYQDAWLTELARIAAPGAILLLSVIGDGAAEETLSSAPELEALRPDFERDGILYIARDDAWAHLFPSFYRTTLHTERYIREHWSRWFEVVDYRPRGSLDYQDLVVLRKA